MTKGMVVEDRPLAVELAGSEGHFRRAFVAPADERRIRDALFGGGDDVTVNLLLSPTDEDDTQGHLRATSSVRARRADEGDAEASAISLQFPSAKDAAAFSRRLTVTGILSATLTTAARRDGAT